MLIMTVLRDGQPAACRASVVFGQQKCLHSLKKVMIVPDVIRYKLYLLIHMAGGLLTESPLIQILERV